MNHRQIRSEACAPASPEDFAARHIPAATGESRMSDHRAGRSRDEKEDGHSIVAAPAVLQDGMPALANGSISLWSNGTHYHLARNRPYNPAETLTIFILSSGYARIERRDKVVSLAAGQAIVFLNNDCEQVDLAQNGTALSLHLPIATVALLVPDVGKILMLPMDGSKEALRLLVNYATTLNALEAPMSQELMHTASSHLFDLVANALADFESSPQTTERDGIRTARKQAIKEDITVNLTRQDLSPDDIAQRLGITPRYLRKLLQDDGTSFSNLVRHMRLQKALEMLGDPRHITQSISTIAYQAGFSDLSYFNRCFRRQFGVTPTEIRANISPRR